MAVLSGGHISAPRNLPDNHLKEKEHEHGSRIIDKR